MLSAVLVEPRRLELEEVPEPEPGPGEVVLRVYSTLTCAADLRAYRLGRSAPGLLGHEFAGQIYRVGAGVRGFREGDAVMTTHAAPCGECLLCARGQGNLCENLEADMAMGGFAEFVRVGAPVVQQNMFLKPTSLSYAEAAFLEPLASVVQGLGSIPIEAEDTVVILGCGTIGLLYLACLKALEEPPRVFMAGRGTERLELARTMSADLVIDAQQESVVEVVREETAGLGAQVVMDCAGQPESWAQVLDLAGRGSHILLFGGCPGALPVDMDTTRLHYDQITLVGTSHFSPRAVRSARDLLIGHQVRPGPILSGSYPLSQLSLAFNRLDRGEGTKFEIVPHSTEATGR
jgi:L-iditol 2-dehydrogenase